MRQLTPGTNRRTRPAAVLASAAWLAAALGAGGGPDAPVTLSAQKPRTVWDGVYSLEQAERGRAVAMEHCVECHNDDLAGAEGAGLVGPPFLQKWYTYDVERLYARIQETMPRGRVNEVSDADKLDVVAFLLHENGFPDGPALPGTPEERAAILIMPGADHVLQPGALVGSVGCLAAGPEGTWTLTRATEPELTRMDPPSAADRQAAAGRPAGTATVPLLAVFPSPAAHAGHKMEAKGLLVETDTGPGINVLALQMLADACGE